MDETTLMSENAGYSYVFVTVMEYWNTTATEQQLVASGQVLSADSGKWWRHQQEVVWPDDVGMPVPGCEMKTRGSISITWLWRHSEHLLTADQQQLNHLHISTE